MKNLITYYEKALSDNNTYCIKKFEHIPPLPNIMYFPYVPLDNAELTIKPNPEQVHPVLNDSFCTVKVDGCNSLLTDCLI